MNYCTVAFAIIMIISTIQWFFDGRKNFKGPQIDEAAMKNAQIEGRAIDPLTNEDSRGEDDSGKRLAKKDV
jgi:choline transport protein